MKFLLQNRRLCLILLAAVVILVHSPSLTNGFVWDDYSVVAENQFIKSDDAVSRLFSAGYLSPFVKYGCCHFVDYSRGSGETSYRPLVTLSYILDERVWGSGPFGYHLTNLLLHVANAVLLYLLVWASGAAGALPLAAVALLSALIFGVHPVVSEAVHVVSFREDVLAALFFLAGLLLHVRARGERWFLSAAGAIVLCACALFTKENAVMFAGAALLVDAVPGVKAPLRRRIMLYTGYAALTACYAWIRFAVMINPTEPSAEFIGGNFAANAAAMSRVFAQYAAWLFVPSPTYPMMPGGGVVPAVSAAAVAAAILVAAWLGVSLRAHKRVLALGGGWFLLTIIPVSSLVVPLSNYMAARYLYLPVMGICLILAAAFVQTCRVSRTAGIVVTAVYLAASAAVCAAQAASWKNNLTFYSAMAKRYPDNPAVRMSLGHCYALEGSVPRAREEFEAALRVNPDFVPAYNALGRLAGESGSYDEALAYFKSALARSPDYVPAYEGLGVTYTRMNEWTKARRAWERALQASPDDSSVKGHLRHLEDLGY